MELSPVLGAVDDSLLARLKRGEAQAVGEVYDLHHAAIRAFAYRLLGDEMTAEDMVHDVFVSLPGVIARFRGDSSLRTFLIGVAANRARHHVRSATRRRAATARMASEPLAESKSPEQDARRTQLRRALCRALDGLPLDQRVAFVLCEVEERTSREVAVMLDVPEGTVRTRLHHARKKLRDTLAKEGF